MIKIQGVDYTNNIIQTILKNTASMKHFLYYYDRRVQVADFSNFRWGLALIKYIYYFSTFSISRVQY